MFPSIADAPLRPAAHGVTRRIRISPAGMVGTLWSEMDSAAYFLMLAAIAAVSAMLLRAIDPIELRIEERQRE